jgi:hypothetical protein
MKRLTLIGCLAMLLGCSGTEHTVKVIKPIYHHGYYKNSVYHKKLQVWRIRVRWFEKQGVKSVKMKG